MRFRYKKLKYFGFLFLLLVIFTFVLFNSSPSPSSSSSLIINRAHFFYFYSSSSSPRVIEFNLSRHLLVFVHIQKTGGSDFDRNIVKHLHIRRRQQQQQQRNNNSNQFQLACSFESVVSFGEFNRENENLTKLVAFRLNKYKFRKYSCHRNQEPNENAANANENWYFSRQTFGWVCGLHADYTDLRRCVRNYYPNIDVERYDDDDDNDVMFYTILRDPIKRYLSEWKHVSRGATWKPRKSQQMASKCNEYAAYMRCFNGSPLWLNVTLDSFLACQTNLANNRQTRMLAHFDGKELKRFACFLNDIDNRTIHLKQKQQQQQQQQLVDAYNRKMLLKAKENLNRMAFFAINEFQQQSKALFEKTFVDPVDKKPLFRIDAQFEQLNSTFADQILNNNNNDSIDAWSRLDKIRELNSLDIELYDHAVNLFRKRLKEFNIS